MSNDDHDSRDHDSERRRDAVERALRQASIETPSNAGAAPRDPSRLPWHEGDIIDGKYRLDRLMGQGGMGAVFACTHLVTHRQLALKIMLPNVAESQESLARFIREAQIAARIQHPHVVQVYDVGQHDDSLFLVMELLRGRSLREVVEQDAPLSPPDALRLVLAIAEGVGAAHRAGVVHRDLKPDNVIVLGDYVGNDAPRVKVLDFGISKIGGAPGGMGSHTLTRPGEIMGTPSYMSPEQIADTKVVDKRSDIYSLGVMCYELLEGDLPFDEDGFGALAIAVATKPPRPMQQALPEDLQRFVRAAMARHVAERFASTEQLCASLRGLIAAHEDLGSGATLMSRAPDKPDSPSVPVAVPTGAFSQSAFSATAEVRAAAEAPARDALSLPTGPSPSPGGQVTVAERPSSRPATPSPLPAPSAEGGGAVRPRSTSGDDVGQRTSGDGAGHGATGPRSAEPSPLPQAQSATPLSSSRASQAETRRPVLPIAAAAIVLLGGGAWAMVDGPGQSPQPAQQEHFVAPVTAPADPGQTAVADGSEAESPEPAADAEDDAADAPNEAVDDEAVDDVVDDEALEDAVDDEALDDAVDDEALEEGVSDDEADDVAAGEEAADDTGDRDDETDDESADDDEARRRRAAKAAARRIERRKARREAMQLRLRERPDYKPRAGEMNPDDF